MTYAIFTKVIGPQNVNIIDVLNDEKENVRVKMRHVRRRISVTSNVSIIDLSGN